MHSTNFAGLNVVVAVVGDLGLEEDHSVFLDVIGTIGNSGLADDD